MLTRRWRRRTRRGALASRQLASSASAQNYSFDARRIALGGAGGTPNVASKLVERQRRYKSILIPVGLVKVLSDVRVFYPTREDFDFSRAVEFGTSPFHFGVWAKRRHHRWAVFRDVVKSPGCNPDLNAYRSSRANSALPPRTLAEGLMALNWGKTFMLHEDDPELSGDLRRRRSVFRRAGVCGLRWGALRNS